MSSPITEMTKAFKALTISDDSPSPEQWLLEPGLSKRWEDNPKDPEAVRSRIHKDWPKIQAYYESHGVPNYQLTTDPDGAQRFQPRVWPSIQSAGYPHLSHEFDAKFITMCRNVNPEEPKAPVPGQAVYRTVVDGKLVAQEMVIVTKDRVAALEAES